MFQLEQRFFCCCCCYFQCFTLDLAKSFFIRQNQCTHRDTPSYGISSCSKIYIFGLNDRWADECDKNQVTNWCQQSMTEWERKQPKKRVFKQTYISCIANQRLNAKFCRNENQFNSMHMAKKPTSNFNWQEFLSCKLQFSIALALFRQFYLLTFIQTRFHSLSSLPF